MSRRCPSRSAISLEQKAMVSHHFEQAEVGGKQPLTCTVCQQTWASGKVDSYCPGVPVLREHNPEFATKTTLAKERLYPPDEDKPDAAYRYYVRRDLYYGWLYRRDRCIARPLTEGQLAGNAKREKTTRLRYGCRFCTDRYTKKHHDAGLFEYGACQKCRTRIRDWNAAIS